MKPPQILHFVDDVRRSRWPQSRQRRSFGIKRRYLRGIGSGRPHLTSNLLAEGDRSGTAKPQPPQGLIVACGGGADGLLSEGAKPEVLGRSLSLLTK